METIFQSLEVRGLKNFSMEGKSCLAEDGQWLLIVDSLLSAKAITGNDQQTKLSFGMLFAVKFV